MTLKNIILHSRTLTDRKPDEYIRKPIVDRAPYAANIGFPQEGAIKDLEGKYTKDVGVPFKVVNIKNCIVRPTILQTRTTVLLYAVEKRFVVQKTDWYGHANFNLNPPTIYYGDWMDAYAKRFIITKEYLGLYAGLYGVNNNKTAGGIIKLARTACKKVISQANTDLSTEQSAFYMAMETLLPTALRTQYDWLVENNATPHQIALTFMVPDEIIEHYQSSTYDKACSYAGLSKMLNDNIIESDIQKVSPRKWFKPQF